MGLSRGAPYTKVTKIDNKVFYVIFLSEPNKEVELKPS